MYQLLTFCECVLTTLFSRSQPVAYVIKPRDRFSMGIDGSLWRVEQERQRLSRMDASVRPVEYVFNAQVHRDEPAASKPAE